MAPRKVLLGGVGAAAVLGVRAARSLRPRPQAPPAAPPQDDRPSVAAPVEPPEASADVSADDVATLREDLRRELGRLAEADVKASRSRLRSEQAG
jgi:hypothetical protein